MLAKILGLLFPARCVVCSRWDNYLCQRCWGNLQFLQHQFCPYCGGKSPGGRLHNPRCIHPQFYLDGALSALTYNLPAQKLITNFKYYPQVKNLNTVIETIFRRYFTSDEEYFPFGSVITAVPLHKRRQNERGFNQAQEIATILGTIWELPTNFGLLQRIRNTKPQAKLTKPERAQNIKGAFSIKTPDLNTVDLKGKTVIVVDDVWTTGSTLKECAKVLKQEGGAKSVWAVTLARD